MALNFSIISLINFDILISYFISESRSSNKLLGFLSLVHMDFFFSMHLLILDCELIISRALSVRILSEVLFWRNCEFAFARHPKHIKDFNF